MKVLCVLSQYAYGVPERGENYDYVNFLPAWRSMGNDVAFFDSGDRSAYRDFADLNEALLKRVSEYKPDVIFCVRMHYEIWSETLDLIRENSPALIVNWGTDDSWKFGQASRFFARHVDLHVTTDSSAELAAKAYGMTNVLLSQWAASRAFLATPFVADECRYDVSFVGSMYGYRAAWIEELRQSGVVVSAFGHGTENGVVSAEEIPRIFRDSRVSLNFSGAGQGSLGTSSHGRQIKARTFEVPGAGGFLVTESAPGLERYYIPDEEVVTFESAAELISKVRYFLDRPTERDQIARAGQTRTSSEHVYETRFVEIMKVAHSIARDRKARPWSLSVASLSKATKQYQLNWILRMIRSVLVTGFTTIYGAVRGPRAARRVVYELSWRVAGEYTYRAGGWPGRLFYRES